MTAETRKTLGLLWKRDAKRQKAYPEEEAYYEEFKEEIDAELKEELDALIEAQKEIIKPTKSKKEK